MPKMEKRSHIIVETQKNGRFHGLAIDPSTCLIYYKKIVNEWKSSETVELISTEGLVTISCKEIVAIGTYDYYIE